MIVAEYPETEAPVDPGVASLLASEATHRIEAEYAIPDEYARFVELHRLIPMGEHEHPFVIVANDYDSEDTWQVFGTHKTAWAAFHTWVEVLREDHLTECDKGREKCKHAPLWTPPVIKIVRRKEAR
jgi:hypothetical protein